MKMTSLDTVNSFGSYQKHNHLATCPSGRVHALCTGTSLTGELPSILMVDTLVPRFPSLDVVSSPIVTWHLLHSGQFHAQWMVILQQAMVSASQLGISLWCTVTTLTVHGDTVCDHRQMPKPWRVPNPEGTVLFSYTYIPTYTNLMPFLPYLSSYHAQRLQLLPFEV